MRLQRTAAEKLLAWFEKNRREMAWRSDPTPYHVWVSEIMLQQTRVETVHAYYARFLRRFPTLEKLADAPEEEVLKAWEGLGYYSRVRNLQKAAKTVVSEYGGRVPDDYETLKKLPGIGAYTAGAILSIAYGKPVPVADGNVLRVMTRFHGITDDIRDPKTGEKIREELGRFLKTSGVDPSLFNQGLMELGALVCVPNGAPHCEVCPFRAQCIAGKEGRTDEIPVMSPKPEKTVERKTVFLLYESGRLGIQTRSEEGLLAKLSGFPMKDGKLPEATLRKIRRTPGTELKVLPRKKHVFTHRIWEMDAIELQSERFPESVYEDQGGSLPRPDRFVTKEELEREIALPAAFRKWPLFAADTEKR